jgi:hypothetical protein
LNGPAVENKGMALFPRKIGGLYAMLGRQDAENIYVMFSDHLHFWHTMQLILEPAFPWEFIQLGNCGSPIETEAGWLVISHGVGPMRKYCIGAFLLDRDDPTKVIGRLPEPLIKPNANERDGYVPNVVYSCGSLVHGGAAHHSLRDIRLCHNVCHDSAATSPGGDGIDGSCRGRYERPFRGLRPFDRRLAVLLEPLRLALSGRHPTKLHSRNGAWFISWGQRSNRCTKQPATAVVNATI